MKIVGAYYSKTQYRNTKLNQDDVNTVSFIKINIFFLLQNQLFEIIQ